MILLNNAQEIRKFIYKEVADEPFEFRRTLDTREYILCLWMLTEKYKEVQKHIYVCFIGNKNVCGCVTL